MAFKITGQNIYFRKTQQSDIDTIALAADFNPGISVPTDDDKKRWWYLENKLIEHQLLTRALSRHQLLLLYFSYVNLRVQPDF